MKNVKSISSIAIAFVLFSAEKKISYDSLKSSQRALSIPTFYYEYSQYAQTELGLPSSVKSISGGNSDYCTWAWK